MLILSIALWEKGEKVAGKGTLGPTASSLANDSGVVHKATEYVIVSRKKKFALLSWYRNGKSTRRASGAPTNVGHPSFRGDVI